MTTRRHDMPFGAQQTAEGTRFCLWAPGCETVQLCLKQGMEEICIPMLVQPEGWHELTLPVAMGTRYRFQVHDGLRVPDPASRSNPEDVHAASEVIDPAAFAWQDSSWRGRSWEEAVIYELHVGTFSPQGTFAGVEEKLDYLVELGVTAIELMPIADFPGARNWGYDGVLPFAPDSRYGRPEELKALIQAAHARGLMVLLDVVYNHFGPDGNYLWVYAKKFFTERHHTPWGAAINYDDEGHVVVREFFIHNALYWLEEYHFDGLRLDAVHAILDDSPLHILTELAQRVHARFDGERHVHLVLENDANEAHHLGAQHYAAQWNDDVHHAWHVLLTGEQDGYYADYVPQPLRHLGRCLSSGFAYQGEISPFREQRVRGEPSAQLPPQAFINFLQCHDQVGNRAFGDRIHQLTAPHKLRAAVAATLLAPQIPMLFMGEEFAAKAPFQFFCDFEGDLRKAVTEGRRREFGCFARFADSKVQAMIPDPNLEQTFMTSKLDWAHLEQAEWLAFYRHLLQLRHQHIVPRLAGMQGNASSFEMLEDRGLRVVWHLGDDARLQLLANLSDLPLSVEFAAEHCIFSTSEHQSGCTLPPWSVHWSLEESTS